MGVGLDEAGRVLLLAAFGPDADTSPFRHKKPRLYILQAANIIWGEAYNVASGRQTRIRTILDTLCRIAGVSPEVTVDPGKYRPTTILPSPDISKLTEDTGWVPEIDLETSLKDVYETI